MAVVNRREWRYPMNLAGVSDQIGGQRPKRDDLPTINTDLYTSSRPKLPHDKPPHRVKGVFAKPSCLGTKIIPVLLNCLGTKVIKIMVHVTIELVRVRESRHRFCK
jgi:hypothetical protein